MYFDGRSGIRLLSFEKKKGNSKSAEMFSFFQYSSESFNDKLHTIEPLYLQLSKKLSILDYFSIARHFWGV